MFCQCRRRQNMHPARAISAPAQNEIHQALIVDHRICVRHHHQRRDPARRRRAPRGFERFSVLGPRFANHHAHIDEARRNMRAAGVDELGPIGRARHRANVENFFREQYRPVFDLGFRWVDQARITDEDWAAHAGICPFFPCGGEGGAKRRMRGRRDIRKASASSPSPKLLRNLTSPPEGGEAPPITTRALMSHPVRSRRLRPALRAPPCARRRPCALGFRSAKWRDCRRLRSQFRRRDSSGPDASPARLVWPV